MKGTAAKRCKLCESQQHNKYCFDHRLKVDGFSAAAEKAAAAPNDLLGFTGSLQARIKELCWNAFSSQR